MSLQHENTTRISREKTEMSSLDQVDVLVNLKAAKFLLSASLLEIEAN